MAPKKSYDDELIQEPEPTPEPKPYGGEKAHIAAAQLKAHAQKAGVTLGHPQSCFDNLTCSCPDGYDDADIDAGIERWKQNGWAWTT